MSVEAMPTLNRAIKLASFMTPFTPLLNNSKPTAGKSRNQSTGECLENQLT